VPRALVSRLARRAGIDVREEPLPVARVRAAAELFLTATTAEVLPVVRLDGRRVGPGTPGPVTRLLAESYRRHVRRWRAARR
jgi:branched-subunit amino acid aminotransferase/4-amino-4-deoxychorismate lyase